MVAMSSVPDYATLCPYSNFCTSAAKNKIDADSCCQKCSCDLQCLSVGTCCPDFHNLKRNGSQDTQVMYDCLDTRQLLDSARNASRSSDYYRGRQYRVVDSCPPTMKKQFPGCEKSDVISDLVPVSDNASGFVYRNKECAGCHGVSETVDWRIHIWSCDEIMTMSFETTKDRNEYIFENCEMDARPPESFDVEIARCYLNDIVFGKCNISGQWDSYDPELEKECLKERSTQNTIYYSRVGTNFLYANVYCFLCNVRKDEQIEEAEKICDKTEARQKGTKISFSALLDIQQANTVTKGSRCSSSKVWDHFAELCRPVQCPVAEIAEYGRCVNYGLYTSGFIIEFFLELTFTTGNLDLLSDGWKYLENIFVKILPGSCGLCGTFLYNKTNSSALHLSVDMHTSDNCSAKQLIQSVKALYMRGNIHRRFKYQSETFAVNFKVVFDAPANMELLDKYLNLRRNCLKPLKLQLYHIQICPKFMVLKQELEDLGFDGNDLETTNDLTIISDNSTSIVSICVTKYFQLRESAVDGACNTKWPGITIVVVALVTVQYMS